METEALKRLGIRTSSDIPAWELLDETVNPLTLNLDRSSIDKILILRDIMHEYRKTRAIRDKSQITGSRDAVRVIGNRLTGLDHEEVWVLFLDSALHVTNIEQMFTGGRSCVTFDPILIARKCIVHGSTQVIVFHNHPSGNAKPGQHDIVQTRHIRDVLKIIGATLVDHIVIGCDTYYSFADEIEYSMS